jgi:2-oxoglutarate ferredoxin oxidoreductase subunit alpha
MRQFIDGAQAIARGAIAAGCNFFAGYPITPATPILHHMFRELPKIGGVSIQGEDEIASIGMCIGAAMAGAKCMTATSGPGMSLYSENIGLAIMGEVPLVIVDVMRLGPATGGATTVGQGDTQFVRWGTSGGYPIIALCPTNPSECYSFTIRAFKLAKKFRCPVFLLSDREVVATMSTVESERYEETDTGTEDEAPKESKEPYVPYAIHDLSDVPYLSPYGGKNIVRFTGSTHDERGFLTQDPVKVARLNEHLAAKIENHSQEIESVSADIEKGARTLLVSYGITARSNLEATRLLREKGSKVSNLTIHSLWPVPEISITKTLEGIERVVVSELNLGQYKIEVERIALRIDNRIEVMGINRVDGELISPQQIMEAAI